MALPPRSKGGIPGWLLDAMGSSGWENHKPQGVWVKGCATHSHRGLPGRELQLVMDLHFLAEHLNLMLFILALAIPYV